MLVELMGHQSVVSLRRIEAYNLSKLVGSILCFPGCKILLHDVSLAKILTFSNRTLSLETIIHTSQSALPVFI